jgi:predicted nuclease of restriction endonuclease-like (RecB) superfamily
MHFSKLIDRLFDTHLTMQVRAGSVVNQSHTLRNWLFGYYIVEFEQQGQDYAEYGERLLYRIAAELKKSGLKGISYTNLTLFRRFYTFYPQIASLTIVSQFLDVKEKPIPENLQTSSEDSKYPDQIFMKSFESPAGRTLQPEILLSRLTFSHFVELLKVDDPNKRFFYEVECIKGTWTRIQLQRQIGSLLYERTGLSQNKEGLLAQLKGHKALLSFENIIRDPYVFEFAGLKGQEIIREKALEKALLDHLQNFLLELGTGFCFEARQKSFLIDNRRYKVDLLFYHRILKCHVMIDLKADEFNHEDAGQMNFYLNYHKDNEMEDGDNPPVGIILCTGKNISVVKYATGSLDNQISVSKYMVQLPDELTLLRFLDKEKEALAEMLRR